MTDRVKLAGVWLNVDEWTDAQIYFSAGFLLMILFGVCFFTRWIPLGLSILSAAIMIWYAPKAFKKKDD